MLEEPVPLHTGERRRLWKETMCTFPVSDTFVNPPATTPSVLSQLLQLYPPAVPTMAFIPVAFIVSPSEVEELAILFEKKDDKNVEMIIAWEMSMVRVPIMFK